MKNFVEDETKGPNITFGCVRLPSKYLQRHVERGTNSGFEHGFLVGRLFGESKITNFENLTFYHDVCWFQISKSLKKYLWMIPSLTSAKNPLQICRSISIA